MKILVILILSIFISSCSSKKKNEPLYNDVQKKIAIRKFKKASIELEKENFQKAIELYNKILIDHPTSSLELITLYNIAYAYEGLGYCGSAANRYRSIVSIAKKNLGIKSRALYQLSLNYECLGKVYKAIATLVDVFKIRGSLPKETGLAELPARLAALYAQINNKKATLKYLKHARAGLRELNLSIKNPAKKKEVISKTYYYMGKPRINTEKTKDLSVFIINFKYLQKFLLRSAEIGHKEWSKKATQEVIDNYELMITNLGQSKHKNKSQFALQALATLNELKKQRFPDKAENNYVKFIFKDMESKERRIRVFLSKNDSTTPLSKNEIRKQKDLQNYRTVNPKPILENKSFKEKQLPKKAQ